MKQESAGRADLLNREVKLQIGYFYEELLVFDVDNAAKPIQDALQEVAYANDRFVSTRNL